MRKTFLFCGMALASLMAVPVNALENSPSPLVQVEDGSGIFVTLPRMSGEAELRTASNISGTLFINGTGASETFQVSCEGLTDDVELIAPAGFSVSPSVVSKDAKDVDVTVTFNSWKNEGYGILYLKSGMVRRKVVLRAYGTPLEKSIRNYSFFDYRVNEALHMTDEEHDILASLMRQMRKELTGKPDELQNAILVNYIELALNFCQRFYNRQFTTRKIENSDILTRFEHLLRDYYDQKLQLTLGLPSVQYCADKLCMSANYFGDVIKKTTGDTASDHIRRFVIRLAKNGLAAGETVTQVSDRLGFEYSQHLSRMFKKLEGITPSEYCQRLHAR